MISEIVETCKKVIVDSQGNERFCGLLVRYSNEWRCEDCWAEDQERWSGASVAVDLIAPSVFSEKDI